jgi:DNA-binding transcriptional regulator YiaG
MMVWCLAWRRALVTASNCVSSVLIAGPPLHRKNKNALNTLVPPEVRTSLYQEISLSYKVKSRPINDDLTRELREIDAVVERLRDFFRLNYVTGADVARRIGVRDMTVYSWLQGESRPSKPERISAFLKSIPAESGSGTAPNGYQYREYKNWRGIPKPRGCPFCKGRRARFEG